MCCYDEVAEYLRGPICLRHRIYYRFVIVLVTAVNKSDDKYLTFN